MIQTSGQPVAKPILTLTKDQEALLDLYLQNLDSFLENLKDAEKIQVEIETLHLKKILTGHA
ncbi:hypothetical protein [Rufibacter sp. LB8]|uniref:hypothetical protein n=1 Tax=Rufibacter sp. LB8 TaxID=2777781 RepID=UPI00178C2633|nr:hypothetical protein [Rufibacter sp. LB8]